MSHPLHVTTPGRFSAVLWQSQTSRVWVWDGVGKVSFTQLELAHKGLACK